MTALLSVAHAITISATIPATTAGAANATTPGGYINSFYQFALLIGGVLALAVVVYGGILYMTSIGNPSGVEEAKKWLEAALFGIILLAGAYMILNIINPQLVNIALPTLQSTGQTVNEVNVPTSTAATSNAAGTKTGGTSGFTGNTQNTCVLTANGGTNGSCPSISNANGTITTQNCCDVGGAATCQTNSCPALVQCATQKGFCPGGKTCVQQTIGLSGGGTYACE